MKLFKLRIRDKELSLHWNYIRSEWRAIGFEYNSRVLEGWRTYAVNLWRWQIMVAVDQVERLIKG